MVWVRHEPQRRPGRSLYRYLERRGHSSVTSKRGCPHEAPHFSYKRRNSMKKLLTSAALFLISVSFAKAQTVAPPIAEYKAKPAKLVSGSFQVQNNELMPVAFTVEGYRL